MTHTTPQRWTLDRHWSVNGSEWRAATPAEITALQQQPGAPHVTFACACGRTYWHAKNIALSDSGHYTGARNIFYAGDIGECDCPAHDLICIVPAK